MSKWCKSRQGSNKIISSAGSLEEYVHGEAADVKLEEYWSKWFELHRDGLVISPLVNSSAYRCTDAAARPNLGAQVLGALLVVVAIVVLTVPPTFTGVCNFLQQTPLPGNYGFLSAASLSFVPFHSPPFLLPISLQSGALGSTLALRTLSFFFFHPEKKKRPSREKQMYSSVSNFYLYPSVAPLITEKYYSTQALL